MVESRVRFVRATKHGQMFFAPQHISVHARKQWANSTIGCIIVWIQHHNANFEQNTTYTRIQSWFSWFYQHSPDTPKKKRNETYGWIPGQFCAGNRTQTNIFTPRHVFARVRKPQVNSTCGCIMLQNNVTMRFLNEIQLILESNLAFQGFINIDQTQPMVESWGNFVRMTKCSQFFTTWYVFITVRKRWVKSTIGCITPQIQSMIKYEAHFVRVIKCRQFFCAPDIFSVHSGKQQPHSTTGCIMLQIQHHNANLD